MPFIGNKPSAVPLTSADIADSIITSAKIVDGTIVNADINASAAIASTKLSGVTSDYVLLATTDASASASVSFDGYFSATYRNYKITISNLIVATDNTALRMRFRRSNADLTDSYYVHILDAAYINSSSASAGDQLNTGWNQAQITLNIGGVDNTDVLSSTNIDLLLYNPFGGTTKSICTFIGTNNSSDALYFYSFNGAGVYTNGTTALSGVSFFSNSGNLASGNFKLYGIK
jgi:hypothetical protein